MWPALHRRADPASDHRRQVDRRHDAVPAGLEREEGQDRQAQRVERPERPVLDQADRRGSDHGHQQPEGRRLRSVRFPLVDEAGVAADLEEDGVDTDTGRVDQRRQRTGCRPDERRATARVPGRLFEAAAGGTLFLDEIGEMSPVLQVKLLRALGDQEVRSLGDTESRKVDVRLVSATNRDLEAAVDEGNFRQDLYYRINTVTIYVPPLRRRRVDIPFLAQHFAEEIGATQARSITLDEGFLETLSQREFPGNVRELRNAVERAITLAERGEPVTRDHLDRGRGYGDAKSSGLDGTLREIVNRLESETIRTTLDRFEGNVRLAAEALGLSRPGLRYKMRRLGLED